MFNDLEDGMFYFTIEYFSGDETKTGRVDVDEGIKKLIEGYSYQFEYDDFFSEIIGHKDSRQISAKIVTYKIEFEMHYKESAEKARPFRLSLGKKLSENLFLNSEFSDVKILCEDNLSWIRYFTVTKSS